MEKTGIVIKTYGNKAVVQIMRETACGENCAKCGGCSPTRQTVEASNDIKAAEGDRVKMRLLDEKVLLAAFFVYIVPIFTLIAGYLLFGWAGAAAGLLLPFILLKILDKRLSRGYTASIIKILGDGE